MSVQESVKEVFTETGFRLWAQQELCKSGSSYGQKGQCVHRKELAWSMQPVFLRTSEWYMVVGGEIVKIGLIDLKPTEMHRIL